MSRVLPPRGMWQCFECLRWNSDRQARCGGCDLSKAASEWREETIKMQRKGGLR